MHAKLDKLHSRVASFEAQGSDLESMRQAHVIGAKEKAALQAHHASLAERVEYIEKTLGSSADRHAREVAAAHGRLDQLHSKLADEGASREAHHASVQAFLTREREAREMHQASIQERLVYLEDLLGESADKHAQDLQTQHTALHSRVGVLEQKLNDNFAGLRDHVHSEKQLRAQHIESMAEQMASEKRARDALEQAVHHHFSRERQAREGHEASVQEQLGLEQASRDRHHEHIQELFIREREARERGHALYVEHLERERSVRDASHKELQAAFVKEKGAHDHHHASIQQFSQQLRALRDELGELLAQEKAERGQNYDSICERVETIQRSLATFDGLIRTEIEERTMEAKHLWRAIDSHTHDLSTQTVEVAPSGSFARAHNQQSHGNGAAAGGGAAAPPQIAAAQQEPRSFAWQLQMPPTAGLPPAAASVTTAAYPAMRGSTGAGQAAAPARRTPPPMSGAACAANLTPPPSLGRPPAVLEQIFVQPPALVPGYTMPGGWGGPEPQHRERHIEKITCGHTRYGGERHNAAEIPTL